MISLEKPSNLMLTQIVLLFFMWYFIHDRTALAVRNRFSKNNIKKKKRGILNRLFFYKFHKIRPLGIWYYLNIAFPILLILNILILIICYIKGYLNIIDFVLLAVSFLSTSIISSIAEIKTTKDAFKTVHGTEKGANTSIVIGSIVLIVSSIAWAFYLYYVYATKLDLNG